MMRSIALASFVLVAATSAQATTTAFHQQDGMITQIADGCGLGWWRFGSICVARTTIRLPPLYDYVPTDAYGDIDTTTYPQLAPVCHRSEEIVRVPSKGRGTREIKIIRCP